MLSGKCSPKSMCYLQQPGDCDQWIPRPWLPSLYRTLTKIQRKKLADRIKKLKITVKRKKQDGSISVSMSQFILEDFRCIQEQNFNLCTSRNRFCFRCGGPDLQATQIYPDGFGKRICNLHQLLMDPRARSVEGWELQPENQN